MTWIKNHNKISIIILITVLLVVSFLFFVNSNAWPDTKLRLTRYWGYFTFDNNPLLGSLDTDLKDLNESEKASSRVDLDLLLSGGPGKDGIPSIDNPKFDAIDETKFDNDELVVGVFINGEARAYPYGILNWHEIVNDKIGDTPIAVTLCPLCDTNPVFVRKIINIETTFGVSGKLFQSCLVMFDRLTDSLWAQPWGIGITGENVNGELERVPSVKTTLGDWKEVHPNTKVLSTNTGHNRDYFKYPYGSYSTSDSLLFPARNQDDIRVHPKEVESYLWQSDENTPKNIFSGESVHFTQEELEKEKAVTFNFTGLEYKAIWNEDLRTIQFFDENGDEVPSSTAFAFVYPAYFE